MNEASKTKAKRIAEERKNGGLKFCTFCGVDLNKARSLHHFHCNKAECITMHRMGKKLRENKERAWHDDFSDRLKRQFAKEVLDAYKTQFGDKKKLMLSIGYTPSKWFEDTMKGAMHGEFDKKNVKKKMGD